MKTHIFRELVVFLGSCPEYLQQRIACLYAARAVESCEGLREMIFCNNVINHARNHLGQDFDAAEVALDWHNIYKLFCIKNEDGSGGSLISPGDVLSLLLLVCFQRELESIGCVNKEKFRPTVVHLAREATRIVVRNKWNNTASDLANSPSTSELIQAEYYWQLQQAKSIADISSSS